MCAANTLRFSSFATQKQALLVSTVQGRFLSVSSLVRGPAKTDVAVPAQPSPTKAMSTAMKQYLQKKRSHDEFIAKERSEFELGKKHLANMMGMNSEAMTQEDIDKAIDYLFPSGLLNEGARPIMKPPEEVTFSNKK
jgi:small subunit ribosomal protein S9